MKLPEIEGVVERRLLVNYRIAPDVAARLLPQPFRPQLVEGWAVAGICLLRLGHLRPRRIPRVFGMRSENAAHRIAVEWETASGRATGVWIPRRDTASLLNVALGGRIFPGEHELARFRVDETLERLHVVYESADATTAVNVLVEPASDLTGSRLFQDLSQASRFFEAGSVGYSATQQLDRHDELQLQTTAWRVNPVTVIRAKSSFFDDTDRFPAGSATLDCGLLMRDVPVTWRALAPVAAGSPPVPGL